MNNQRHKKTILIDTDHANMRMDRFLAKKLGISVILAQKLCRQKKVKCADSHQKIAFNDRTKENQKIHVFYKFEDRNIDKSSSASSPSPQPSEEDIYRAKRFIDDHIIGDYGGFMAINKPSGIATQGGSKIKESVDGYLRILNQAHCTHDADNGDIRFALVHRLDRDTSGILLIAKSRKMTEKLGALFKNRDIKKTYLAITHGSIQADKITCTEPLCKRYQGGQEKMVVDHESGVDAKTIIKKHPTLRAVHPHIAVHTLSPETGRTHQLRVHTSFLNIPILFDPKYGKHPLDHTIRDDLRIKKMKLCLHAWRITMMIDHESIAIEAPLPNHIKKLLDQA